MSEVLRLDCEEGSDLIMLLTEDDALILEVQKDSKGEYVILPEGFMPKRKTRKIRVGT